MYRRLIGSLPADHQIPHSLEDLGYFINSDHQIRSKANPDDRFKYKVSRDDRYNEMQRTVMHHIIRDEVVQRMRKLNMSLLYLPQMTVVEPENEQYLPIYTTNLKELKSKTRVLIVIPDHQSKLGTWAFGDILDEPGMEAGSAISLVHLLKEREKDTPGLIIMNPGEMYFSHEFNRPMTLQAWQDRHRASPYHPMPIIHDQWNRIPNNESPEKHIQYVFEKVINSNEYVCPEAKIDIVGIKDGGEMVLAYLDQNCEYSHHHSTQIVSKGLLGSKWSHRVSSISLISSWQSYSYVKSASLRQFLKDKARAWEGHDAPPGVPIACPFEDREPELWEPHRICPTLSGGLLDWSELVFPRMQRAILEWVDEVAATPDYVNPKFEIQEFKMDSEDEGRSLTDVQSQNHSESGIDGSTDYSAVQQSNGSPV
jgi:Arb2 domain-containing protein